MFFALDGFAVMEVLAHQQCPQERPSEQAHQQVQAGRVGQMGVFHIKPFGLQKAKRRFNGPAFAIHSEHLLEVGSVGDQQDYFAPRGPMTDQLEGQPVIEDRLRIEPGGASSHALGEGGQRAQAAIVERDPGVAP